MWRTQGTTIDWSTFVGIIVQTTFQHVSLRKHSPEYTKNIVQTTFRMPFWSSPGYDFLDKNGWGRAKTRTLHCEGSF